MLAAGASRRFGDDNKLLAPVEGRAMITRVLDALDSAGVAQVVVVTGWDRAAVSRALQRRDLLLVHNPAWEAGMGGSIAKGVAALDAEIEATLIVPGDIPLLTAGVVRALIDAYEKDGGSSVVYPATPSGGQRNPVLWPRQYFSALQALPAAEGAKALLNGLPDDARRAVQQEDEFVFADVDTRSELAALRPTRQPE